MHWSRIVTVIVCGVVACSLWASPASAETQPRSRATATSRSEVLMRFVPVTSANASQYGYEIRREDDGVEYAFPVGTGAGQGLAATGRLRLGAGNASFEKHLMHSTSEACGRAGLQVVGRSKFVTDYVMRPGAGIPIRYNWSVKVSVPSRVGDANFDLARATRARRWWADSRRIDPAVPVGEVVVATASGYVVTERGVCEVPELRTSTQFSA